MAALWPRPFQRRSSGAAEVCKLALGERGGARSPRPFPADLRGPMLRARRMRVPVRHRYRALSSRAPASDADHLDYEEGGATKVFNHQKRSASRRRRSRPWPDHPHRVGDPERHRTQGPDDAGDATADLGEDFRQEEKPEQAEPVVDDQGNGEVAVRSATALSHPRSPDRRRSGRRRARPRCFHAAGGGLIADSPFERIITLSSA